jgi:two-component system, NtrC family, nitrogen regulation response regulator NtrX
MASILIVDDENNILKTLKSILEDEDHTVFTALKGEEGLSIVKDHEVDLAILDVWLPDIDGLDLLSRMKEGYPDIAVIMMSGHGSIDIAVKSTKTGAFDFLVKPPSMERVLTSVNNALEHKRLKNENIKLRRKSFAEDEMIGETVSISRINEIIDTAAKTNARVFITGDSGTGKELIARAIYQKSNRADQPFVKVNCAAIPDDLIESELFGHEMGAFTGAVNQRIGKFEKANNGTIFLDEICDMSLAVQAKVLRVLQEQQFERVGGNDVVDVDVRVISATNIDVKQAIDEDRFREDLYFRLNVIPIQAPSLSERREDIPLLIDYFMNKFSIEHGIGMKEISEKGLKLLMDYSWPGNVRELKNIIERLLIMVTKNRIEDKDIEKYMESYDYDDYMGREISPLKTALQKYEKSYIINALKKNQSNAALTARELGLETRNLHRKLKLLDIDINRL